MLTYRKAIAAAAVLLALLYLLSATHNSATPIPITESSALQGSKTSTVKATPPIGTGNPYAAEAPKQKSVPQQSLADIAGKPLRDQLRYHFPYDIESKFPAYIWQTWKTSPASGQFGENLRPMEASWSEKHPGFVHEVVTDDIAPRLIRYLYSAVPDVVEAYESLPMPVLKADFFRYLILLARGGIYTDIDTIALKPTTEWLPEKFPRKTIGLVTGIEADPDRPDWAQWYSRRIQLCQWTIQSKSGHPVLRDVVATITEDTLRMKKAGLLEKEKMDKSVIEFTGPAVWTDAVFRYFNNPTYFDMASSKKNITWEDFAAITTQKKVGDVIVLPITSFSPGVDQMNAGSIDDPMAFVEHKFEGTFEPANTFTNRA